VRAWHTLFRRALYIPSTAVVAALNFFYVAYRHRAAGREWRGYAGAGAANLLLPPFTQVFIMSINRALIASGKRFHYPEVISPPQFLDFR
jgi:hypothetical protein